MTVHDLSGPWPAFTTRAANVGKLATERALAASAPVVDTRHILAGIVDEQDGVAAVVLRELGVGPAQIDAWLPRSEPDDDLGRVARIDPESALETVGIELDAVRARTDAQFGEGALGPVAANPPPGETVIALYGATKDEALNLGHNYIGTEHQLLAFTAPPGSAGVRHLGELGVDPTAVRGRVLETVARFHVAIDDDRYRVLADRQRALRALVDELDLEPRRAGRPIIAELDHAVWQQWAALYPNPSESMSDDAVRATFLDGIAAAVDDAVAALDRAGIAAPG